MPPKGKEVKKGAPVGNYKAGKLLKDILPPNTKPPREGVPIKVEGEVDINRSYAYDPYFNFPEWTSNDDVKNFDYNAGCHKKDDGTLSKFEDQWQFYMPPSFSEFEKGGPLWLRPEEYLREIAYDNELSRRKHEKKMMQVKKKNTRKQSILALGLSQSYEPTQAKADIDDQRPVTAKEDLKFEILNIGYDQRLENEEEIRKRKEEAEKLAALDKNAKKKAPAPKKGEAAQTDPMDEPQLIKVPVESNMDMGFAMPAYVKWVTSQFQFIKDRSIRDVDSKEPIYQRIYPQENGIPIISPTGKYFIKLRYMGKERIVEIDDRMPCNQKSSLMFPRSINTFEIWPQLIAKAILKVYSYKWYSIQAQYDNEVGDGSIVYSLTGLIPEHIPIKDFEGQGLDLFRQILSDDHYFGKKTYATCYCDNEFRPKMPSQATTLKKIDFGGAGGGGQSIMGESSNPSEFGESEPPSGMSINSSSRMLGRLRDVASLAISVTTGKKLNVQKAGQSNNVITGFGYALMDIFENQFVDMDSIQKKKDAIEEVKSPFHSPGKNKRDKNMTKDEWKKKRKDEKKKEIEEWERRQREPPKQFSLVKIKTSAGRYPVMSYLSAFTSDEIYEAKKCFINHQKRPPEIERMESPKIKHSVPKKDGPFTLNVHQVDANQSEEMKNPEVEEPVQMLEPKTRAPGGVWLLASDFPHSFQNIIVYHNLTKYPNVQQIQDRWENPSAPYINNEKEVMIKLELDEEALKRLNGEGEKAENPSANNSLNTSQIVSPVSQARNNVLFPGEVVPPPQEHDKVLIGFAPFATGKAYELLPRYLMRATQICPTSEKKESSQNLTESLVDLTFKSYFESKIINFSHQQDQKVIWLKPNIVAPLGFNIWAAGLVRKISIVPRSEYLIHQKQFVLKTYQSDFLPLEKGKYHLFNRYDFQVQENELILNLKLDIPTDKYLLKYLRLKVINKETSQKHPTQTENQTQLNMRQLENMVFPPNNGKGYSLIIEGVMPYNTNEGQLQLEVLSNSSTFALEEIQMVEPLEFADKYAPSKYGIIFKEKIYIGPDHTSAAINVKLKQQGREFDKIEGMSKLFKVMILDQGQVIFMKEGYNQITLSHFLFRSSNSLPEKSENQIEEVKHAYVIQAVFDLYEWPDAKSEGESTQDITLHMKLFTSETLAIVRDTDKEDKEKALKGSWEQAEPGRAEKAKRSRQKFILQQKLREGEELTPEELAIVNEVRERIRKKDEVELPVKGGKPAPAGKAPAKGGPPAKDDKNKGKAAAQQPTAEEEEKNKRVYPEPSNHINNEIREFLNHFKSDRLIQVTCDDRATQARRRDEEEKQSIAQQRQKERETAQQAIEEEQQRRELMKESREVFKKQTINSIEGGRQMYKEKMSETIGERNKYREMIALRKEKDKTLQDLMAQDKIDLPVLQKAIDEATENLVRAEVISKGEKQLVWLKYCKEVEVLMQQALSEKNKDKLVEVLDKIDKEQILIDAKMLQDAKNNLAKMK